MHVVVNKPSVWKGFRVDFQQQELRTTSSMIHMYTSARVRVSNMIFMHIYMFEDEEKDHCMSSEQLLNNAPKLTPSVLQCTVALTLTLPVSSVT